MDKLCKSCQWRCKVVLYHIKRVIAKNQCFIRIDAGQDTNPIGEENCDYYEPVQKRQSNPLADYLKEKGETK